MTAVPKRQRLSKAVGAAAPAVAVDLPGCSYNPEPEQHQDALAAAVAAEVSKAIEQELQPLAPQSHGDGDAEQDELALLQVPPQAPGLASPIVHRKHALQCLAVGKMRYHASVICHPPSYAFCTFPQSARPTSWNAQRTNDTLSLAGAPHPGAPRMPFQVDEQLEEGQQGEQREHAAEGSLDRRRSEPKTQTQRNKELRRKAATTEQRERLQQKTARQALGQLKQLVAELDAEQQRRQAKALRKQASRFQVPVLRHQAALLTEFLVESISAITADRTMLATHADRLGRKAGCNAAAARQASVPTGASAGEELPARLTVLELRQDWV